MLFWKFVHEILGAAILKCCVEKIVVKSQTCRFFVENLRFWLLQISKTPKNDLIRVGLDKMDPQRSVSPFTKSPRPKASGTMNAWRNICCTYATEISLYLWFQGEFERPLSLKVKSSITFVFLRQIWNFENFNVFRDTSPLSFFLKYL